MPRQTVGPIAAALAVSLIVVSSAPAAPPSPYPPGQVRDDRIFGYEVGEERRYVLGPPESLPGGETASWLIRLESLMGTGQGQKAVFAFEHHREVGTSGLILPMPGQVMSASTEGAVTVNGHGFPLEVTFTLSRHYHGYGDEVLEVRYAFDGERFEKEVWIEGKRATTRIPLRSHEHLDRSVPVGLFVFLPESVSCGGWQIASHLPTSSSGGIPSATLQPGPPEDCTESDPAFANPGFLSLVLPALWEARGQRSFLFLTPTPPEFGPGGTFSFGARVPGMSVRTAPGSSGSGREKARDLRRQYSSRNLAAEERTKVKVGRRNMDATRIDLGGTTVQCAYVDDEGKVLRVDLHPGRISASSAGPTVRLGATDLWIRLLFPSEY